MLVSSASIVRQIRIYMTDDNNCWQSSVDDVQFDNILQLTTIHMHIVGLMQAIRYTIIVIITL